MESLGQERKAASQIFSLPFLLQQILQFFSPLDLLLKLQFLSKSVRASLYSSNQFIRWSLKNALGQCHFSG